MTSMAKRDLWFCEDCRINWLDEEESRESRCPSCGRAISPSGAFLVMPRAEMTPEGELMAVAQEYLTLHDPGQLRRVAAYCVGRGGEYLACGRFLECALEILYPDAPKPPEKEPLSFEKAYGSQTRV